MPRLPPPATAVLVVGIALLAGGSELPEPEPVRGKAIWVAGIEDRAPQLLIDLVNDTIKGRIIAGATGYSPPRTITLNDVVVTDPQGAPVVEVQRVTAVLDLAPLLAGDISISDLRIRGVKLTVVKRGEILNILQAFEPRRASTGERPDVDVTIAKVSVERLAATYSEPAKNVQLAVEGGSGNGLVDVRVRSGAVRVVGSNLVAASGTLRLEDMDVPFSNVTSTGMALREDRLVVRNIVAVAAGAKVLADVKVQLDAKPQQTLEVKGDIDAPSGAWPRRLEPLPFTAPAAKAKFLVTGPLDDVTVAIDGTFGAFKTNGYAIDKGSAQVEIRGRRVRIRDARAHMGTGRLYAAGTFQTDSRRLDLETRIERLPVRTALAPAKMTEPLEGTLDGNVRLEGAVRDDEPLAVSGVIAARNLRGYGLVAPELTTVDFALDAMRDVVHVARAAIGGRGLVGQTSGKVFLKQRRLALAVSATLTEPGRIRRDLPEELAVERLAFDGQVIGPFERVRAEGKVTTPRVVAWGQTLTGASADLVVDARMLAADNVRAALYHGAVTGAVTLDLDATAQPISGTFRATEIILDDAVTPEGQLLGITGRAKVEGRIEGPVKSPTVLAQVSASRVVVRDEPLGEIQSRVRVTKRQVSLLDFRIRGPSARARAARLLLHLDDKRLSGTLDVRSLNLARLVALKDQLVLGEVHGPVRLGGTLDAPDIVGMLQAKGLRVRDAPLGDGPTRVQLVSDGIAAEDGQPRHVIRVAARLSGDQGELQVRAALAVQRKVLNLVGRIRNLDLAPWTRQAVSGVRLEGTADARVWVSGPLDRLDGHVEVHSPELVFAPLEDGVLTGDMVGDATIGRAFSAEVARYHTRGALRLEADVKDGVLDATLCAFPTGEPDAMSPCGRGERAWAVLHGPVDQSTGDYALEVEARADVPRLDDFVPVLQTSGTQIDTEVSLHVDVSKQGDSSPRTSGLITIAKLAVVPQGAPRAQLARPGVLRIERDVLTLEEPLRFEVGHRSVQLAGQLDLALQTVNLSVTGSVALSLMLLSGEIQNASGSADAWLTLTGPWDSMRFDGCLTPSPDASFTPRSLAKRVSLRGGQLCFARDEVDPALQVISPRRLEVGIDDGRIILDGSMDIRNAFDGETREFPRWALKSKGRNLSFGGGKTFVEGEWDLTLRGDKAAPRLSGRIEVTEGFARERFELSNFVVTQAGGGGDAFSPKAALAALSLEALVFDVDIVVQSFQLRADLASFRIDAAMRGDLHLADTLEVPRLTGALDVSDGQVRFPYATFDVEQTEIEFLRRPDGRIQPRFFVVAATELDADRNGLGVEVPATLRLDGDIEQMTLALEAPEAPVLVTQNDLLKYVLFGSPLRSGDIGDPNAALRAVSRELTAAFTRDLEATVAEQFGTELQFQVFAESDRVGGGVRYQLGDRVELEGETGFVSFGGTEGETDEAGAEARVRLLIVDHLPAYLGREIAFVGQVRSGAGSSEDATANGNLRLTYRIFEF